MESGSDTGDVSDSSISYINMSDKKCVVLIILLFVDISCGVWFRAVAASAGAYVSATPRNRTSLNAVFSRDQQHVVLTRQMPIYGSRRAGHRATGASQMPAFSSGPFHNVIMYH